MEISVSPQPLELDENKSPFEVSRLGMVVSGEPSLEECTLEYENLMFVFHYSLLWIGDLLNYADSKFGESFAQMVSESWGERTISNIKWVTKKVPLSRRQEPLTFSHYAEVAALDGVLQNKFILLAVENEWSTRQLRAAIDAEDEKTTTARMQFNKTMKFIFGAFYRAVPIAYSTEARLTPKQRAAFDGLRAAIEEFRGTL